MLSIVYSSRAASDIGQSDLRELLTRSRSNNERDGLTGMLLYRSGYFLQVLEGPDDGVRRRLTVIEADERHDDVKVLIDETIEERLFPEWTMAFDAVPSDSADQVPGLRTTFDDLAAPRRSSETLGAVRALVAWYRRRF